MSEGPEETSLDRVAIATALVFGVAATILGHRTGNRVLDVDELVFQRTLQAMRHGTGYYHAMRAALIAKEGAAPSQIRSVRPPTIYLALSLFPASSWRWLAGIPLTATPLLAVLIGRPLHRLGGLMAAIGAGLWMLGAARLLYLHAELWALPFFLAGVLLVRRHTALGIGFLVAATAIRELYGLALLLGLVLDREHRRAWLAGVAVVAALAAVHIGLTLEVLTRSGREARFREHASGIRLALSSISPGNRWFGWVAGLGFDVLGLLALARLSSDNIGARLWLLYASAMALITVLIGRQYWGLVFGPLLAAYAGGGLTPVGAMVRRARFDAPGP